MNKVDKLAVAAKVAPEIRDRTIRARRVTVYDHETGEVLREAEQRASGVGQSSEPEAR